MAALYSLRDRLRMGLARQVVCLVLLAVLLTGGLVGWIVTMNSRDILRESVLSRNLATAVAAGNLADQFIDVAETTLDHLSVGPLFGAAVRQRNVADAEGHMEQLMQTSGRFDSVSLYSPEGIGWASGLKSDWKYRGGSVADREWFQHVVATNEPYLGIAIQSRGTGSYAVPYAIPMLDTDGRLMSVMVGGISIAALSDSITQIGVGGSAKVSLVDRRAGGMVIADTQSGLLVLPIPFGDETYAQPLKGGQGTGYADDGTGGQLTAFAPVGDLQWSIVIQEPAKTAFAPVNRVTRNALIVISAVLAVALLAGVLLARRISSPLRRLAKGAEAVGQGDLDYRIGTARYDEVGAASRAFDRMTAELKGTLVSRDELATEVTERLRAVDALRELAERQQAILAAIPDILMEVDNDHVYTWANSAGMHFFGDDVVGQEAARYFEGDQDTYQIVSPVFENGDSLVFVESWQRRKDGEKRLLAWVCRSLHDQAGNVTGALSSAMDITDRRKAEEALRTSEDLLRQSQKMEAVGQLAGGIAHDFNNLLTAIIGYTDLVLSSEQGQSETIGPDLREIKRAAERASSLTRQILAFSRRQALQPAVVRLNDIVSNMEPLLHRTLGEGIALVTHLQPSLAMCEIDVNQFEQVVMNLALNARDATPLGGHLTIETHNVRLDEEYCRAHPETVPGDYVMLSLADDGVGMDNETLSRIFEPFFTTKGPGEGTGLGLSTVYGIVRQSGGSIAASSTLGEGTTFKVYLPRAEKDAGAVEPAPAGAPSASGGETILVVEDEEALRTLVERVLSRLGYSVLTAGTAKEAWDTANDRGRPIDLLLTDVVLPGAMQGNDLAGLLTAQRPALPVLYMSGYARDAFMHEGRLGLGVNYLQKPFTPSVLAAKVRDVLDCSAGHGTPA